MAADATDSVETVGKVLAALSMTTSQKEYSFTKNASRRTVQGISDAAWYYAYATGGPYFPVPAYSPFDMKLNKDDTQSLFFKTQGGTGTLNLVVKG